MISGDGGGLIGGFSDDEVSNVEVDGGISHVSDNDHQCLPSVPCCDHPAQLS